MRSKKKIFRSAKSNPVAKAPVDVVICSDIEQVSFANFLKCVTTNNYSCLTISGEPNESQLFLAWITILSNHYTLIKSREQLKYIKLVAKMEALNLKITIVTALCESLRMWMEPKLIECLRVWGYKLPFTDESILSDIDRVLIELENDNFKLEKLRVEYNADQKNKKSKGETTTKDAYMKILYAIEKHRAQRYPPDKISLYEFDMWYNELNDYNEAQQRENDRVNNKSYRNGTK